MSVFGASVHRTNLEIISLLTSNTPGGITTFIERSVMPTPRQPIRNSHRAMFSEDWTCFDIFCVSWAISRSPTSSIPCRLPCLTTSRCWLSTSWRRTTGSMSTMECGYPCPVTMTSHQKLSHRGSIPMEWEGDEGNELEPAWSCNAVSTRMKPRSAFHLQSRNWVQTGIVRILYVFSL